MKLLYVGDFQYPEGTQSWDEYVKNNPGNNSGSSNGLMDKLFMIAVLVVVLGVFY